MATKKQKISNVPNLRFPGFEGEWKMVKLTELVQVYDGTHQTPNYVQIGIPFYSVEQLTSDNFEKTKYISEDVYEKEIKRVKIERGDILMTRIGDIGTARYVDWDVKASFYVSIVLIKNISDINMRYLHQFISTPFFQKELWNRTIHVAFPKKINLGEISECNVLIPTILEQQKIASLLTLIDQRIETQNKIIDSLETLIKGLSESLLNQKIRYKDDNGDYFPDWKIRKMGQVFTFKVTNSYSREKLNYQDGDVQNIHYGDVHTKYKTLFNVQKESVPYINSDVNISKIEEENYCKEGDVIIADASEDLKDVGKSVEVVSLNGQKVLAGLHTILARPLHNIFSIGFCGYLFKSEKIRLQIQKEAQGSKVLSISSTRLSNVLLDIPALEEQNQIAISLSAISEKIEIEKNVLKKYLRQKKCLLSKLFM